LKKPPHFLVTTPESLYLLVTAEKSRQLLGGVRTLIIDEIHALAKWLEERTQPNPPAGNPLGNDLPLTP
jgi:Lhr-like helicase